MYKLVVILFTLSASFGSKLASSEQLNENGALELNFGISTELKLDEKLQFGENISIILTSFSHKRPMVGGPTKATASLLLTKDEHSEQISLSIHGTEGMSESEGGDTSLRYDRIQWNEYEFQLKKFNYGKSIEVIINKTE